MYDLLTVEEHLYLYGVFKGTPSNELTNAVNEVIKDVNLEKKRHDLAKNLSGG